MSNTKKGLVVLAVFLVGFVGLRIYAAFQNEQRGALLRASHGEEQAAREQQLADQDTAELDCSDAWGLYRIAEKEVQYVRITEGELAYLAADMEADKLKPICSYEFSLDASTRVGNDRLDHESAASESRALAMSERKYAADRKTQGNRIRHKIWATFTGAAPETPEEWTKFLAQQYDGILGNLVLGTPLDPASAAEIRQQTQKALQESKQLPEKTQREIEEIQQRIQQAARRPKRR